MEIKGTTSKSLIGYIHRVATHLGIDDELIEITVQSTCDNGAGGFCYGDEDEVQIEIARKDSIDKFTAQMIRLHLAHELIHAHQLLTGRMVNEGLSLITNDAGEPALINVVIWDGETYSEIKYEDQPWEIDAYAREGLVYRTCM